ncbi:hypothetical protein [Kitasatospora sp. GP82]|uniref:hypothetical protein n=1 Tax=Kitasatospora sp. GP82 TaxID=3035089 RepID=UPI002475385F|nr:hypothetical protein [Kitasatospora sp. GP82]
MIEWDGDAADDGTRGWQCPQCRWFGYTLPTAYAERHLDIPVLQVVGRLVQRRTKAVMA